MMILFLHLCENEIERGPARKEGAKNEGTWRFSNSCSDHLFISSGCQARGHQAEKRAISDDGKLKALKGQTF